MVNTKENNKTFDQLILKFLSKNYSLRPRLVNLEIREIREKEIKYLLKQAEVELDAVVCFMDAAGALKYVSPSHDQFFGIKEIGQSNAAYTHPEDLPMLGRVDVEYLMKKKPCGFIFRYKSNNDYVKVFTKCYPVINDNEELIAYFSTSKLVDDTEEMRIVEI